MSKPDILTRDMAKDFCKGLLKLFLLKMLDREPMHGYAMMNRLEEMTGIRPSSGTLHPALMKLTASGLINVKPVGMKKVYSISKKGKERVRQIDENFDDALDRIKEIYKNI